MHRSAKKQIVFIECGAHAREWISIAVGMRLINIVNIFLFSFRINEKPLRLKFRLLKVTNKRKYFTDETYHQTQIFYIKRIEER